MKEVTLNTDSFNQNPQFENEAAVLRHIYNLIVMKKGTDPLNPDKGVDINRFYYAFKDDVDVHALEQEIKDQVSTYTNYLINNVICQTSKSGTKWVLHVILTIPPFQKALVISTNGDITQYTEVNTSRDIIDEIT